MSEPNPDPWPGTELEKDLLSALARIYQVAREGLDSPLGQYLFEDRILTCDAPRLQGHISVEALAWADRNVPGWSG